jgi:hypothetical protein
MHWQSAVNVARRFLGAGVRRLLLVNSVYAPPQDSPRHQALYGGTRIHRLPRISRIQDRLMIVWNLMRHDDTGANPSLPRLQPSVPWANPRPSCIGIPATCWPARPCLACLSATASHSAPEPAMERAIFQLRFHGASLSQFPKAQRLNGDKPWQCLQLPLSNNI